eukprot:6741276-Alexandrium_andersonii.AAC.1
MSASLVGSEMCIRDRQGAPECVSSLLCFELFEVTQRSQAPPRKWILNAVSYTHLTLPTICSV